MTLLAVPRWLCAVSLIFAVSLVPLGHASAATRGPLGGSLVVGPGYTARVFATGGGSPLGILSHPDALAAYGGLVYVGYANATVADGSDGGASTVVAYTSNGRVSHQYALKGSISSLRADPTRKILYAVMNRLGNSTLDVITPTTGITGQIALPANPPHGGGFGDIAFVAGKLFVSASNPVLNDSGTNTAPALDRLTITAGVGSPVPLLMGNAKAIDVETNQPIDINEVDPTTLAVSPTGDLLMINQAGAEIITVHKPAGQKPLITSLLTGTQLVDLTWTSAGKGRLLVADTAANAIYAVDGTYGQNALYTISAADSGVSALLGTLNLTTGAITPFAFGLKDPAALLYTS
jgi:hypothetical protein